MLLSYEVAATFGVSALLSFTVFTTILLLLAAKRGLLQTRKNREKVGLNNKIFGEKLLPQSAPAPSAPELTPPPARHLLHPRGRAPCRQ